MGWGEQKTRTKTDRENAGDHLAICVREYLEQPKTINRDNMVMALQAYQRIANDHT